MPILVQAPVHGYLVYSKFSVILYLKIPGKQHPDSSMEKKVRTFIFLHL